MRLINYKWGSPHLKLEEEEEEAGKLFDSQGNTYLKCNVSVFTVIIKCIRALLLLVQLGMFSSVLQDSAETSTVM